MAYLYIFNVTACRFLKQTLVNRFAESKSFIDMLPNGLFSIKSRNGITQRSQARGAMHEQFPSAKLARLSSNPLYTKKIIKINNYNKKKIAASYQLYSYCLLLKIFANS